MTQSITRREALQTAGTLLLASAASSLSAAPQKAKRVIVAGGGLGGLSCAYELMERGHEVTLLEASRRTGGHVKTIRDPLPDGLYADVGAEHFTRPGYVEYWKYVGKFDLPFMPWKRRLDMYRNIGGKWFTEAQLQDPGVLRDFGFNAREVTWLTTHIWPDLATLYFAPYLEKFTDEFQPYGVGLAHLDDVRLGDLLAKDGASDAAIRFIGGRKSSAEKPATRGDISALYRLWQAAIVKLRGLPIYSRDVFHLRGGNQLLPDTFTAKLGERVRKNCPITAIEHNDSGVKVTFTENERKRQIEADYLVVCCSPLHLAGIEVTPAWPAAKKFAIEHVTIGMQSRVLLQARTPFWKGDVPSINLETGDKNMVLVYETADEVPGESCVLMGSGAAIQTEEDALAAFRKFYPGKAQDTIERCIVHQWWKEEPTCFGCERQPFAFGELRKMWPHIGSPVGRIYFAGAAYDNMGFGMDAATRTANRVAEAIHAA